MPETDTVVVFLPPAPGVDETDPRYHRAVYLSRGLPRSSAPLEHAPR